MRQASINRQTSETQISATLNLDGSGKSDITCGIGFFTHMLQTLSRHGLFDLQMNIAGDLHIDQHHTLEDSGIVLGEAFRKALGDKRGIHRAGFFIYPMDECLATVAVDISGRPCLHWEVPLVNRTIGEMESELMEDFFLGLATSLAANIHVKVHYGRSDHHKIEAVFKAFARAMRAACEPDPRAAGQIPSTKGSL